MSPLSKGDVSEADRGITAVNLSKTKERIPPPPTVVPLPLTREAIKVKAKEVSYGKKSILR